MSGEEWRRGVHAELDGYFAARRGGTLPRASRASFLAAGQVCYCVRATVGVDSQDHNEAPEPGRARTSLTTER